MATKKINTTMQVIKHMQKLLRNDAVVKMIAASDNKLNVAICKQLEEILNSDGTYRKIKSAQLEVVADQLRLIVVAEGRDTASFVIVDNSRV